MANYGEYSGAPSETQTFEYAKTILKLMTEGEPHPDGEILFFLCPHFSLTSLLLLFYFSSFKLRL